MIRLNLDAADDIQCVICTEPVSNTDMFVRLSCSHVFHAACLHQVRQSRCPSCRQTFSFSTQINDEEDHSLDELIDQILVLLNHADRVLVPQLTDLVGRVVPTMQRYQSVVQNLRRQLPGLIQQLGENRQRQVRTMLRRQLVGNSRLTQLFDDTVEHALDLSLEYESIRGLVENLPRSVNVLTDMEYLADSMTSHLQVLLDEIRAVVSFTMI